MIRADLRNFTSFFGPDKYKNPPSIFDLANAWQSKGLDIVSLTAAHSATGGIDNRFQYYANQSNASNGISWAEVCEGGRYLSVAQQNAEISPALIILNSQQVRAYHGVDPVELNVLGVKEIIKPTRPILDIIKQSRDSGGIVLLSHVGFRTGLPLESAVEFYHSGLVDGVEIGAYNSIQNQSYLEHYLEFTRVESIPVTGGHSYKQAGTSYIDIKQDKLTPFSIQALREAITTGAFKKHFGNVSPASRFWNRDRHILAGIPGNFFGGKKRREENARVLGLK